MRIAVTPFLFPQKKCWSLKKELSQKEKKDRVEKKAPRNQAQISYERDLDSWTGKGSRSEECAISEKIAKLSAGAERA